VTTKWTLTVDMLGRPTTTNRAHQLHHHAVSADRKQWRKAGCILARQANIPPLDRCEIEVTARYPDRRSLPDPDGVAPAAKGVIDGLIDAGIVPDDSGDYVASITYHAPVVAPGKPAALLVTVRAAE
jgi:crossover junction endodeoxyribonuclease RusA